METSLYRHFDSEGQLLYVGISLNVVRRLTEHMGKSSWAGQIDHTTIKKYANRTDAVAAEKLAIVVEQPLHNTQLLNDPDLPALPDGFEASYLTHEGTPVLVTLLRDLEEDAFALIFDPSGVMRLVAKDYLHLNLDVQKLLEICNWVERADKWFGEWKKTGHYQGWMLLAE